MEEDIVYLEEVIDLAKTPNVHLVIKEREIKALENLIKGYREREKNNNLSYNLGKTFMNKVWKSKIKEKIDAYSKSCAVVDAFIVDVLQELMEDK